MSDEPDDPETAAARLESALDRIARLVAAPRPVPSPPATVREPVDESALSAEEIADRLDSLIGRLRAALGSQADRLEQG